MLLAWSRSITLWGVAIMRGIENTALDLLLRSLGSNPMDKLPVLLSIAEKLDRRNLRTNEIQLLRRVRPTRRAYGISSLKACSAMSTGSLSTKSWSVCW